MKKKFVALSLCGILSMSIFAGCGAASDSATAPSKFKTIDTDLKVGMVIGTGTIDDRSFNQGTWEGINGAIASDSNKKYLKPAGETEADYLQSIANLHDGGFEFIIAPGYKLESAIFEAQDRYPDTEFVILDGEPRDESGTTNVEDNTVAIYFAEHEAGFLAAVAAAVELKEGDFGFIGGMPVPAVKRFESGFAQGIEYANANLGTNITFESDNSVYQGTFDDKAAGQQIAAQMYDRGVDVIFACAGGTGIGVITEAKERMTKGEQAWVIGVDSDQYQDGIYDTTANKSAILTSAIKYVDQASYDMIAAQAQNAFPGGEVITYKVANDGVGLPAENPNLSEDTIATTNEVYNKIKSGEIVVTE